MNQTRSRTLDKIVVLRVHDGNDITTLAKAAVRFPNNADIVYYLLGRILVNLCGTSCTNHFLAVFVCC